MIKILFVCHGNICRSPMAEFVMKDLVAKAGLEHLISVSSCAVTYEEIGMNVDGMTLQVEGEDKVELQPTDKRAVFTFELQP